MLTQMVLWFAVTAVSVVTANPLLQAIASQRCPICERNALKNQLQNLLFQTANNYQPPPQMYMNQNPAQVQPDFQCKRSCPVYPQTTKNQNYQAPPYQQPVNQPYCPYTPQNVQHQGNPLITEAMNRLFSNPALKSILDPTTKLLDQNGQEIPRNGACSNGPPQVVNNYIIVPPEFLMADNRNAAEDTNSSKKRRKKIKNNNVSEIRSPQSEDTLRDYRRGNIAVPVDNTKINGRNPIRGERKQRRREKVKNSETKLNLVTKNTSPKPHESDILIANKTDESRGSEKETVGPTKNQNSTQNIASLPDENVQFDKTVTLNNKDLLKENDVVKVNVVKSARNQETNHKDVKTTEAMEIDVQNPKDTVKRKHNLSSNNSNKRIGNNHRKPAKVSKSKPSRNYNLREEAVVNDFKMRFPNIPEDVVRNLFNHLERQLMSQNLGSPQMYYPQVPLTFDQLYGNRFAPLTFTAVPDTSIKSSARKSSNNNQNQTKKRKSRVRNKQAKKTTTSEPCDAIVELTPTVEVTTAVQNEIETTTLASKTTTEVTTVTTITAPTTTEVPTIAEVITEPIKAEPDSESEDIQSNTIETTTPMTKFKDSKSDEDINKAEIKKEVKVQELGLEDAVPTIYLNDLYDEYYPDFTGDLQYYSDEDFSYFGLEDDRYHYTTDKNFPLEELNRERRRFDAHADPHFRRPQDRHIFTVQNRERVRPKARPVSQRRKSKLRTSPRPTQEIDSVTPKIYVIVKENTKPKSNFVESNTEKPKSEENQFRTPPTLEFIDFETKPINKQIYFHNDYKSSSYSDMKTPNYNPKSVDQIQTDFAGSKVATYGRPVFADINLEEEKDENDDTIIVMAKTVEGDYW